MRFARMTRRAVLVLCLLLLWDLLACGDGNTNDPIPDAGVPDTGAQRFREQVDELVRPVVEGGWVMGMVVGLVTDEGTEIYGYGKTGADGTLPDGDTLYEIGSVTKTFLALVLATLVDEGTVTLDQTIQSLLPPSQVTVPEMNGQAITLEHLITHTSGLPDLPDDFILWPPVHAYDAETLYAYLNRCTLNFEPGTHWAYSSLGVGLLGHALSLEMGQDFGSLVHTRITEPLGLTDTAIALTSEQRERLAVPHFDDFSLAPRIVEVIHVLAPAGAMHSSARDLLGYISAQMNRSISPLGAAIEETQVLHYRARSQIESSMGLGWFIDGTEAEPVHFHTGETLGSITFLGFDRARMIGAVVLINTRVGWNIVTDIGFGVLRLLEGLPVEPLNLPPAPVDVPAEILQRYVGTYRGTGSASGSRITVELTDERLYFQWKDQPRARMYATSTDQFYLRATALVVTFVAEPGGTYDSLLVEQGGGQFTFEREMP